jgi:hypothetical protein
MTIEFSRRRGRRMGAASPGVIWFAGLIAALYLGLAALAQNAAREDAARSAQDAESATAAEESRDGANDEEDTSSGDLFGIGSDLLEQGPSNPLSGMRGGTEPAEDADADAPAADGGDAVAGEDADAAPVAADVFDADGFVPSEEIRVESAIAFPVDI